MNTALEVLGLEKRFSGFTLGPLSFVLPSGHIMGLVGPNGAGKTTLIRCLLNLSRPSEGRIRVLGLDSRQQELTIRQMVGYVSELHPYYQDMTVAWTVRFRARFYRFWDQRLCEELLAKYEVPARKRIKELSKGTRAKLSLALALAHRPRLLVLDEPMSGLDPLARHDVLQEMLAFVQDEDRAVLFSTHILDDVERVADYVVILNRGKLLFCGEKDDLLADWKSVSFPADRLEELRPWLRVWRREGNRCLAVTDRFRDLAKRQREGGYQVETTPLSLDELLLALARPEAYGEPQPNQSLEG
ncbi:MAG: ABC transporter ATP-binding protein [Moorellales bacterium]